MAQNEPPVTPGVLWRTGNGAPAPGLGGENDMYLRLDTGRDYQKIGGAWGLIFQPTLPAAKVTGLQVGSFVGQIIEMAGGNPDAGRCILCDGAQTYLKADFVALNAYLLAAGYPYGSDATHFGVPDKRERVSIGASAGTAVGATEGVTFANRSGRKTRHQHTKHKHDIAGTKANTQAASGYYAYQPTALGGSGLFINPEDVSNVDGGSGVATDPLDGPAFVATNFYILYAL